MAKILVIEDDDLIAELIERSLSRSGFDVTIISDGQKGYEVALVKDFDVIVLDIMLPNKIGLEICSDLRQNNVVTPILFLSSRNTESEKVMGLDLGADDYLEKPFGYKELSARVKALIRRSPGPIDSSITINNLSIDTDAFRVTNGGKEVQLRNKEYELLKYLMERTDKIVPKAELLMSIWGITPENSSNRLEACMKNLRKALGSNEEVPDILTVRNMGYKIVSTSSASK